MTSNERKIINFLRKAKGEAHVRLIAQKMNFSSDYTQSLCRSLARAGYIKLENSNICSLLKKGHGYFENVVAVAETSEPVIAAANVTLPTDEPASMPFASDRDNKDEEDHGDEEGNKEGNQHANDESEESEKETGDESLTTTEANEEEIKPVDIEAELKPEPEEIKEKEPVAEKEESVKPSDSFGIILKKIIGWFAEKK